MDRRSLEAPDLQQNHIGSDVDVSSIKSQSHLKQYAVGSKKPSSSSDGVNRQLRRTTNVSHLTWCPASYFEAHILPRIEAKSFLFLVQLYWSEVFWFPRIFPSHDDADNLVWYDSLDISFNWIIVSGQRKTRKWWKLFRLYGARKKSDFCGEKDISFSISPPWFDRWYLLASYSICWVRSYISLHNLLTTINIW